MIHFPSLEGFEWDDGNRNKNWVKHNVSIQECEEVFFNDPLIVYPDLEHSYKEKRYLCLGKTNAERRLFIAFTLRLENNVRVISARDMGKKEKMIYEEENT